MSLTSPVLAGGFFTINATWEARIHAHTYVNTHIHMFWGEWVKEFDDLRKILNGVPKVVSRDT